jgi:hypothetical protein
MAEKQEEGIEAAGESLLPENLHGHCYCGQFEFLIPKDVTPYRSVFCHCDSCRRAHASPLYQVIYIPEDQFRIVNGQEMVREYRKENSNVTRAFCKECGSRLFNKLHGPNRVGWLGFFPNLLDEHILKNLPTNLLPTHHLHTGETILDLEKFHDELLRIVE